jgi:hypothetical protein
MAEAAATTDAAADAMSDSMSGVSKDAEKESKKTEGFFSKIGNSMSNMGLPFSNTVKDMGAKMDETSTKGQKFAQGMSTIGGAVLAVAGIAAVGIAGEAIHMADEFDTAQAMLKVAVVNSGASWSKMKDQITGVERAAADMGFNMTDAAGALQILTTATNDPKTAMKDLGLAEDLARMKGISLGTATQTLAKLYAGSTRALTQLGINLDIGSGKLSNIHNATIAVSSAQIGLAQTQAEITSGAIKANMASIDLYNAHRKLSLAEEKLKLDQGTIATIMKTVTDRTRGAATAYGLTLTGQMDIAKAHIHDLGIQFGEFLLPKLDAVIQGVSHVITWFSKNKDAAKALGLMVGGFLSVAVTVFAVNKAKTMISALQNMGQGFTALVQKFVTGAPEIEAANSEIAVSTEEGAAATDAAIGSSGIGLALVGLGLAVGLLVTHWKQAWAIIKAVPQAAMTAIKGAISLVTHPIKAVIDVGKFLFGGATMSKESAAQAAAPLVNWIHGGINTAFSKPWKPTIKPQAGLLDRFYHWIVSNVKQWPSLIGTFAVWLWGGVEGAAKDIYGFVKTAIKGIPILFDPIRHFFASSWDAMLHLAGRLWSGWWSLIKSAALNSWHWIDSAVFRPIASFFAGRWRSMTSEAARVWGAWWGTAKSAALTAWHWIDSNVFHPIASFFAGRWRTITTGAAIAWGTVWGGMKSAASTAWHWLSSNVFSPISSFFSRTWHTVIQGAGNLWHSVWAGFQHAVQDVWSVIKPIINAIAAGIHGISTGIGTIGHIAGDVGGAIGKGLKFLHLGTGGLVSTPSFAIVAESGPEYVMSPALTRAAMASGTVGPSPLIAGAGRAAAGGGPVTVEFKFQFNGRTFANAMAPDMRAALMRTGRHVINVGLA